MRRHLGFPGNRCRGGRGSRESPGFPARLRAAGGPGSASPPGWAGPGRPPPAPRGAPGRSRRPWQEQPGSGRAAAPPAAEGMLDLMTKKTKETNTEKLLLWKSPSEKNGNISHGTVIYTIEEL
ncbi:collagen alpha-1(III) chain-like [Corvus moneduloides]|uniref:collagen alpha-1(III) chain-like n=1 Tax=Corvus moneduloides TaxID=1196302 RepID=UPI0013647850|nr:collagen alpha-1(III) chain-like [Corvus moneduloides]